MYKPGIVKQILGKDITINQLADLIQKSKRYDEKWFDPNEERPVFERWRLHYFELLWVKIIEIFTPHPKKHIMVIYFYY